MRRGRKRYRAAVVPLSKVSIAARCVPTCVYFHVDTNTDKSRPVPLLKFLCKWQFASKTNKDENHRRNSHLSRGNTIMSRNLQKTKRKRTIYIYKGIIIPDIGTESTLSSDMDYPKSARIKLKINQFI